MRSAGHRLLALLLLLVVAAPLWADETPAADAQKYLLRYKFQPNEAIRWQVVHRAKVVTTVSGASMTSETVTRSVKLWRVLKADAQEATFENIVESVELSTDITGRARIHYNSTTDKEPPGGYENMASSIGVPLAAVTVDGRGTVKHRENRKDIKAAAPSEGSILIPLPEAAVAVGQSWTIPNDIELPVPTGGIKKIKAQQRFVLKEVRNDVATIEVATQILTPIHDPALEVMLIQHETQGTVRFDLAAGRILGQQMDLDRHVVGYRGEASSMHYLTQFTEELLSGQDAQKAETASRPKTDEKK